MNINVYTLISAYTKDRMFEKDQRELIQILSKGVHIFHPEVIKHLLNTALELY